jgi:hypothetical protein
MRPVRTILVPVTALILAAASRPPDLAFRIRMIDPGFNETVAVADLNNDGKPDIISGESWYEAPDWTKHSLRAIDATINYIDNFSDLPVDVDGDGWIDIVQVAYYSRNIVWLKNPGKTGGPWVVSQIDSGSPNEFAILADLNNDGRAQEVLPEFTMMNMPLAWYEPQNGKWVNHVVSPKSYGHGIGAGDINGDGRTDILTPQGWLEAPPDVHAQGDWTFHPTDWGSTWQQGGINKPVTNNGILEFGFIHVMDVNGDGRPDVVTTLGHDYGVLWFEQGSEGQWIRHMIDNTWSQAHASVLADLNGDGQLDLISGKRYFAHNGTDVGEKEPLGLYWYEFRKVAGRGPGAVEWFRHIIDYGGRMGGGLQIVVRDMDGDGDLDVVSGGKAGLFLAENLTKSPKSSSATGR